jgi:general secretion pathway protein M
MNAAVLRTWWATRAPREQSALTVAGSVLALALLWWIGIAPAWRSLQRAQQQTPMLQAQLASMRSLQAEARGLQALPAPSRAAALQALHSVSQSTLGGLATIAAQGPHAIVTVRNASPQALAQWLAQVRSDARLTPDQVQWNRTPQGWQGTAQFPLPGP